MSQKYLIISLYYHYYHYYYYLPFSASPGYWRDMAIYCTTHLHSEDQTLFELFMWRFIAYFQKSVRQGVLKDTLTCKDALSLP
jgi:hypothetical protein